VAVGADKLALGDLAEDLVRRPTREPRPAADVADLLEFWQVIPLHHLRIEHAPAIGARPSGFQAP
jgi:hypothetical protein